LPRVQHSAARCLPNRAPDQSVHGGTGMRTRISTTTHAKGVFRTVLTPPQASCPRCAQPSSPRPRHYEPSKVPYAHETDVIQAGLGDQALEPDPRGRLRARHPQIITGSGDGRQPCRRSAGRNHANADRDLSVQKAQIEYPLRWHSALISAPRPVAVRPMRGGCRGRPRARGRRPGRAGGAVA
jgi:hypothetical protein